VKRLILFRHAKSSWKDEQSKDVDRPLANRGKRDAPRMGKRLKARRAAPELMLSSHARRALETIALLADELDYAHDDLEIDENLYLASPEEILAVVARLDDSFATVLLVGHNPGLTDLANRLLPDLALDNLPTSGVVAVDFTIRSWRDVTTARATLAYYDYPANPERTPAER
jgi:phosphohistidine phosphatase